MADLNLKPGEVVVWSRDHHEHKSGEEGMVKAVNEANWAYIYVPGCDNPSHEFTCFTILLHCMGKHDPERFIKKKAAPTIVWYPWDENSRWREILDE